MYVSKVLTTLRFDATWDSQILDADWLTKCEEFKYFTHCYSWLTVLAMKFNTPWRRVIVTTMSIKLFVHRSLSTTNTKQTFLSDLLLQDFIIRKFWRNVSSTMKYKVEYMYEKTMVVNIEKSSYSGKWDLDEKIG